MQIWVNDICRYNTVWKYWVYDTPETHDEHNVLITHIGDDKLHESGGCVGGVLIMATLLTKYGSLVMTWMAD